MRKTKGYLAGIAAPVASILLLASSLPAWTPPPNDADYIDASTSIFRDTEVARVDVTIAPADFQDLLDDPFSDENKVATIRWRNAVIDETLTDVGFRVRGGAFTRPATRKSWKLDFNDLVPGRAFHGLESIDLNGDHNDATYLRRRMSHEILRQMGLPSPRTSFVALYINGSFWSMQINVEHIDEEYTDSWFGNKDGNLYKCLNAGGGKADLRKIAGEDYANYAGGAVYDETNNEPTSDYTDLVNFIRLLNDTTAVQRLDQLESSLNVDNFIRYLATDVAVGGWDDYWYGANNWYIYHNTVTNRFEWVPYDYDNTLAIDYFNTNWSTRHFENWGDGGFGTTQPPLTEAIFDHSPWRQQYRRYLLQAAALLAAPANQAKLDTWHAQLVPYFDGTIESGGAVGMQDSAGEFFPYFNTGITQPATWDGSNNHTMGLKPYMTARSNSIISQVAGFSSPTSQLPRIRINEVLASNTSTNQDEVGDFEDWIELHNGEASPVNISGWYLTDDVANPLRWMIPAGTPPIPAGGRLLIWCDNEPLEGPLHAPFSLAQGGQNLGLFMDATNGRNLVDHVEFPQLTADTSYGRFVDGSTTFIRMCVPTPGLANDGTQPPCGGPGPRVPPRLFINEFLASNAAGAQDEGGDFADWVEIYNDETTSVDMSGLHLTDNLANPTKWEFPAGTTIAPKGYILVWCDSEPLEGLLHATWALSAGGEQIGLYDNDENDNQPIDTLSYGAQTTDVSSGRLPNGTGAVQVLPNMTPGASNSGARVADWWELF